MLPVFQSPQPVWRNLKAEDQEFVKQYLMNYPVQNPITYNTGSYVMVDLHGRRLLFLIWVGSVALQSTWVCLIAGQEHIAQVVTMDCSLVKLKYLGDRSEYEWIYSGSTRISTSRTRKFEAKKENRSWIKDAPLSMVCYSDWIPIREQWNCFDLMQGIELIDEHYRFRVQPSLGILKDVSIICSMLSSYEWVFH